MTVQLGYKQTEIGVIPVDWASARIDELARITTGSRNTEDQVEDGSYPFFVRSPKVERINTYSYNDEAVLTVGDGVGTGRVFHYITGKFDAHQRVYCIHQFSDRLDGRYFFYQFSNRFYRRSMSMTAKSSVDSIRLEMIAGMAIPLPLQAEQRAIASALSDVDALLESLNQLIAKKRDIKWATMQQLLTGRTRLPGFCSKWKLKRLGEVLTICHGKSQRDVVVADGPYPVLATGGQIGTASRPLYDKPSVLIGRKGTIDQPQYMATPFWTVDTLFYSVMNDGNCAKFFYYRFCLIKWTQFSEASGVPSLNARTIEDIELLCPAPDEQVAISGVLSDLDAEITALEARRDKTRDLKQAMMQELLTGRTRLVEPEVACG